MYPMEKSASTQTADWDNKWDSVYKTRKCSKYNVEQPLQFIEDSKISNNAHHTTRPEKNVGEKSIYQDDPMLSRKRDDDKVLRDSIKVV